VHHARAIDKSTELGEADTPLHLQVCSRQGQAQAAS
jgi:hypothetical protein